MIDKGDNLATQENFAGVDNLWRILWVAVGEEGLEKSLLGCPPLVRKWVYCHNIGCIIRTIQRPERC